MNPLEETMKIHYFEDVISDSSYASIKSTIMVDHQKFQDFNAMMQLYVNFKRLQKAEALTYQARNFFPFKVAEVAEKAMGDVVVADGADPMPMCKDLFRKMRLTGRSTSLTSTTPGPSIISLPRPRR